MPSNALAAASTLLTEPEERRRDMAGKGTSAVIVEGENGVHVSM